MIETFLQTDWLVVITKIVLATALGYLIGMERELHGKAVGTRTISLIAIGSALYVLMSPAITGGDNSRIIAQVVSGIGFLGAGIRRYCQRPYYGCHSMVCSCHRRFVWFRYVCRSCHGYHRNYDRELILQAPAWRKT